MMKTLKYMISLTLYALAISSCMKDGEILTAVLDGDGTQIGSQDTEIVLNSDSATDLALTIYWDELGNATLSNPDAMMTDDIVVNAVQFSLSEDFGTYVETSVDNDDTSVQFTVVELNNLLSGLGMEGGVPTTVYVRMRTSLGTNSETVYGNVIELTVTTYTIDMSRITLAGVSNGEYTGTEVTIPATDDGTGYAGFANVPTGWWNFFFVEGDNTIWGAYTDGNPFPLEQKDDISSWNAWFPEPSGCYHIEMSVSDSEWSCTSITGVTMSADGAESVQMQYASSQTAYSAVITTSADNVSLQVEYTGTLYNNELGQNSTQSVTLPLVAAADGTVSVGESGTATGITVGTAGTYTLILSLADMTWELEEGEVDMDDGDDSGDDGYTVATSEYLYIYTLSDNTPDSSVGSLARTSDGVYEGSFHMTGWFNFKLGDAEDPAAATVIYGSDPVEGVYTLYCGDDMYNIWWDSAEEADVYLIVDTNTRTWSYTIEDEDDTEEPGDGSYPECLYVIYSWDSGWPTETAAGNAAVLASDGTDGTYTGYFSSGSVSGTGFDYFILSDASFDTMTAATINETRYGTSDGSSLSVKTSADNSDNIYGCWLDSGLGLYRINADLAAMTYTMEYLGSAYVSHGSGTSTPMAFNNTDYVWEATCTFSAGETFRIVLGDNAYVYGGADAVLSENGSAVTVSEAGTYLVTADLKDYRSLTYTIERQ